MREAVRRRILITTDTVGGVWRYSVTLASGLAGRGIDAVIVTLGPAPSAAQRAEIAAIPGATLIETGRPLDWTASDPAELERSTAEIGAIATRLAVDSVHLHAPALARGATWPMPTIVVAHSCVGTWWEQMRTGPIDPDLAWRAALTREGLRSAGAAIAPSQAHAAALERVYGALPLTVVYNGEEPGQAQSSGTPGIFTAGRLWDDAKGADWLDRAAPSLGLPVRAAGPVRGPNNESRSFDHLTMLGVLDRGGMAAEYAGATVFASMARYEPFGLAVLEAAQAGLALVLSDIPVFRELWDGAALFVRHEADLVPALRLALEAPSALGARAQCRAALYTVDAMVDGTLAVHRQLVAA